MEEYDMGEGDIDDIEYIDKQKWILRKMINMDYVFKNKNLNKWLFLNFYFN